MSFLSPTARTRRTHNRLNFIAKNGRHTELSPILTVVSGSCRITRSTSRFGSAPGGQRQCHDTTQPSSISPDDG